MRRTQHQPVEEEQEKRQETRIGNLILPGAPWVYKSLAITVAAAGFAAFAFSRYRIAPPWQRIAVVGVQPTIARSTAVTVGRRNLRVLQTAFVWPIIQRSFTFDVTPRTLTITMESRTKQMLDVHFPIVVTYRPKYEDEEWLCRYAMLMDGMDDTKRDRTLTETGSARCITYVVRRS